MIGLKVTRTVKNFGRLGRIAKGMDRAIRNTVNQATYDGRMALIRKWKRKLDNPTPWILRQVRYKRPYRKGLQWVAEIFLTRSGQFYLHKHIVGGKGHQHKGLDAPLVWQGKRNKYGNPSRRDIRRALALARAEQEDAPIGNKRLFARRVSKNRIAIIAKTGGKTDLRAITSGTGKTRYKKRLNFYRTIDKTVRATIKRRYTRNIQKEAARAVLR